MKVAGERLLGWARVLSGARVRAMEPTPPGAVLAALQLQAAQQQAVYMQAAQRVLQQQRSLDQARAQAREMLIHQGGMSNS